jgi:hypothetical protein
MADYTDYIENVKHYAGQVDESALKGIVRHLGIALQSRDASLVSASDPAELERVRESFLKKALGREESDAELDMAIQTVMSQMSNETNKSRVTVYYLLAHRYSQLAHFA